MGEILLLEIVLLAFSILGVYLSYWPPFTSEAWLAEFGVWSSVEEQSGDPNAARLDAAISSTTRAAVIVSISSIIVVLFAGGRGGLAAFLQSPLLQTVSGVLTLWSLAWTLYLGPRRLASARGLKHSFREHTVPHMAYLPYNLAIWCGVAPITISAILDQVSHELRQIQTIVGDLTSLVSAPSFLSVADLLRGTITVAQSGERIAVMSQKYVVAGFLILLYVVAEQQTNMKRTLEPTALDRLKYVAWVVIIMSLAFGMVFLPTRFAEVHAVLHGALGELSGQLIGTSELRNALEVQKNLESHGPKWLMLEILTGYGNLITWTLLGGLFFLRRVLFTDVPVVAVLELLLPSHLFTGIGRLAGHLGVGLESSQRNQE
jgi:hypothetical protein